MPAEAANPESPLAMFREAASEAVALRERMERVMMAYNLMAFRRLRQHAPEVAALAVDTFGSRRGAAAQMTNHQPYLGGIPAIMVAEGPEGQEKVTTWMNRVLHCCA